MIKRIFGLAALAAVMGPISCLSDEGPEPFTTANTCFRGQTKACDCDEGDGIRSCNADGTFGECKCPGCTVWPDCDTCDGCFEKCQCNTGRQYPDYVCLQTCGIDGGSGDAGDDSGPVEDSGTEEDSGEPAPPASCDLGSCDPAPSLPVPIPIESCCDGDKCGLDIAGQGCLERDQPGEIDPDCPDVDLSAIFPAPFPLPPLPGCCRPDGTCGGFEDTVGFGCFQLDPANAQRCGAVR